MEREKIVLPLAESPIIYSGMRAVPLEITFLNKNAYSWFASAFIQVKCEKINHRALIINHDFNPYIKKKNITSKAGQLNEDNLIDFIKDKIKDNQYLHINLNQFFILDRSPFQNYDFSHMELLFGFDDKNSEFYIKDYNHRQQWVASTIKYSDFIDAFFSQKKKRIITYQLNNEINVGFNYKIFKKGLLCYYKSKLPISYQLMIKAISLNPRPLECYGMETHYHLCQILLRAVNNDNEMPSIKLHAFWEHKKCMVMRLEYVKKEGYVSNIDDIIEGYIFIREKYFTLRSMCLKFEYTRQERIIKKIVKEIEWLKAYEMNLLKELLSIL